MSEDAPRRIQILVAEDTATGRQVIRNHLDTKASSWCSSKTAPRRSRRPRRALST
jgi:hypothetical protein